jgi:hypothetical protein
MTGFDLTEPTEQQKSLVDEALYLRGRIVASYAQVEFLLADISVKLDLRFPYLIDARIKAVRRIAEREGYEVYKNELDRVCLSVVRLRKPCVMKCRISSYRNSSSGRATINLNFCATSAMAKESLLC